MAKDQRSYPGKKLGGARQGLLASNGGVRSFGRTYSAECNNSHTAINIELPKFRSWKQGLLLTCQHIASYQTQDGRTQSELDCLQESSLFYIVISDTGSWNFLHFCSRHPFTTTLEFRKVGMDEFLSLRDIHDVMES